MKENQHRDIRVFPTEVEQSTFIEEDNRVRNFNDND